MLSFLTIYLYKLTVRLDTNNTNKLFKKITNILESILIIITLIFKKVSSSKQNEIHGATTIVKINQAVILVKSYIIAHKYMYSGHRFYLIVFIFPVVKMT